VTARHDSSPAAPETPEITRLFGDALSATGMPDATAPHRRWVRRYVQVVLAADFVLCALAGVVAFAFRFGTSQHGEQTSWYALSTLAFPFVFVVAVASSRAYETRFVGGGSEEYRRVFDGAVRLGALVAIAAVGLKLTPARGYLIISFPLAIVLVLGGRYAARRVLEQLRDRGRCLDRVIAVGRERSVAELIRTVHADRRSGFLVVGVCLDTLNPRDENQVEGVPVFGRTTQVLAAVSATNADTVAITSFSDLDTQAVRRLGWQLEGTDVSMLVAPRITDVAGPRIHIRPVGGLPLLHVEQPELIGVRRLLKAALDRSVACAALVLLSPFLVAVGVAVRMTSRGPAIFRQERVGTRGRTFMLWKFRTMSQGAEAALATLADDNVHADGPLFKIHEDPRITPLGRLLRRWSIDELPQLVQVLTGRMSLVGPRPPLPREVVRYENAVHRRLLVKPGLTGLWQISGRSDLSWDDSVRLDLQYVENWSLALDLSILFRTAAAVIGSRGAY
jgi:exopolysaccharide biosynthesis polyprenyl glycosylphosphotransferase